MFQVDDSTATALMPALGSAGTAGWFQPGVPSTNTPATTITVDWLNIMQAELGNLLSAAGITPVKATLTQVTSSVQALVKKTTGLEYFYFATTTNIAAGATQIIGPSGVSAADGGAQWVMPVAGNITGLYISTSAAPGGSATLTTTVYKNGSGSAASAVISAAGTSNSWAGTVAVAANDLLSVHVASGASAATLYAHGWLCVQPS